MTIGIGSVPIDPSVVALAEVLVQERVMPGPIGKGDALHVAAAAVHRIDYLLTWNVRHLANVNKVEHLAVICLRAGMLAPKIVTPDVLWQESEPGE